MNALANTEQIHKAVPLSYFFAPDSLAITPTCVTKSFGSFLTVLLLLLTSCVSQPKHAIPQSDNFATVNTLQNWKIRARVGFKTKTQSQSAYLNWKQNGDIFNIRISGPFGAGALHLHGNAKSAILEQAGEEPHYADTPDELLHNVLGWEAPISYLHYWVRGIPANAPVQSLALTADQNRIAQLQQKGWLATFERYKYFSIPGFPAQTGTQNRVDLPTKITISKNSQKMTLVISHWGL